MDSEDDPIREVDKFIRQLNDGEFVISTKTNELYYATRDESPNMQHRYRATLADILAEVVNTYVLNKDDSKKLQLAENCRAWIHKAWLAGVIREGKGLAKKLEKCKSENLRLQIELADLSAKYLEKEELIGSLETKYGLDNKSKRNNRKRES